MGFTVIKRLTAGAGTWAELGNKGKGFHTLMRCAEKTMKGEMDYS
jgi:hypothetical protein